MRKTFDFSLMLGMAYVALAFISMTTELPTRLINALSFGAVLFAFSELLIASNNRRIKRRSIVDVLKNPDCKDSYAIMLLYVAEIYKEMENDLENRKTVLYFFSTWLRALAFMSIIVYPFIDVFSQITDSDRFGVFCTILSLGVIFISLFINDQREFTQELNDFEELQDCYLLAIRESNELVRGLFDKDANAIERSNRNTTTVKNNTRRKRKKR